MRWQFFAWAGFLFALGPNYANALTVYQWVDAKGGMHYSNQAMPGANQLVIDESKWESHLPSAKNSPAQVVSLLTKKLSDNLNVSTKKIPTVFIASPENKQTFQNVSTVFIHVVVSGEIAEGTLIRLLQDDVAVKTPWNAEKIGFEVTQIPRGAHRFQVEVFDQKGTLLSQSETVTVYLHQAHKTHGISPL